MTTPHSQALNTDEEDLSRSRLARCPIRKQPRQDWETKRENLFSDREWARWLRQTFHDDSNGVWVSFSLNTRYPLPVLMNKFDERCWLVSKELFDLTPSDQTGRLRKYGLCTFLIPAISASGNLHYHGLIRLPRHQANGSMDWVRMKISENNQETYISVPRCLRRLLVRFDPVTSGSTFGDINLKHEDGFVVFLKHDSRETKSVLRYMLKTKDGELRQFSEADFVPAEIRRSFNIRKGREPRIKAA